MNKNNIIGFLLIAVVLIGFSWYNQPSAEEQRTAFVQDSIAKAKHAEMEKASKAAAAKRQTNAKAKVEADSTALFYSALKGQAKKIVLKNEKVELTLNTKGTANGDGFLPRMGHKFLHKQAPCFGPHKARPHTYIL